MIAKIRTSDMLYEGAVVGLSGGADSIALLFALLEIGVRDVFAVHVNHCLRGAASDRDERFVVGLCGSLGLPLKVERVAFEKFSEDKARRVRYEIFEAARVEFGAECIAVGHNLDDCVETVVMNLCRGAGLRGLCGIPFVNGRIVRPLIDVSRVEILSYLREREIKFVVDESNEGGDFTRNRVRNIVLPMLEREVYSQVRAAIAKNAAVLRLDEEYLEGVAGEAFVRCKTGGGLCIKTLLALPIAIANRVVRLAAAEVLGGAAVDISLGHVADVLRLAREGVSGRRIHLPRLVVSREYDVLIFSSGERSASGFSYLLELGVSVFVPEISQTVCLSSAEMPMGCTKAFSCDKITKSLYLRTRLAGDRISFRGRDGRIFSKKLQDYFTDEKIPVSERGNVALLAHGSDILWVVSTGRVNAKYETGMGKNFFVNLWGENLG